MTKMEKVKKWFKENKKELIIGGLIVIGASVGWAVLQDSYVDVCGNTSDAAVSNGVTKRAWKDVILATNTMNSAEALAGMERMGIGETFKRACFYQDWEYNSLSEKCTEFCSDENYEYMFTLIAERREK